jgi:hypothetical protein
MSFENNKDELNWKEIWNECQFLLIIRDNKTIPAVYSHSTYSQYWLKQALLCFASHPISPVKQKFHYFTIKTLSNLSKLFDKFSWKYMNVNSGE